MLTFKVFTGNQNMLSEGEVHARVGSYGETDVTDALYDFGKLLIAANRDRTKHLESKAIVVVGYAVAVLAFLVSREPVQSVVIPLWPPSFVKAAGVCAAVAIVGAFWALLVQWQAWFSDSQWFENENNAIANPDILKRSHVLAMHAVNHQINIENRSKANGVFCGQVFLLLAGLCLAAWVVFR